MNACDLRIELPEAMTADEAKILLAVKAYEVGKASLGQAAKLVGVSKRDFMEILGRYGVPVISDSAEDVLHEGWPRDFFDSIQITDPGFARLEQGRLPPLKSV